MINLFEEIVLQVMDKSNCRVVEGPEGDGQLHCSTHEFSWTSRGADLCPQMAKIVSDTLQCIDQVTGRVYEEIVKDPQRYIGDLLRDQAKEGVW